MDEQSGVPGTITESVEVRVLTIGGRRMTVGFYEQIATDTGLFNGDGEYQGKVWGWVNRHVGCNDIEPHLHIVWERDGELRKILVVKDGNEQLCQRLMSFGQLFVGT